MMTLFIAIIPACFVNLFLLSYFKMIKKDTLMADCLWNNENSIMNILRRKGR